MERGAWAVACASRCFEVRIAKGKDALSAHRLIGNVPSAPPPWIGGLPRTTERNRHHPLVPLRTLSFTLPRFLEGSPQFDIISVQIECAW
jgi:hypothetical protein